MKLKDVYKGHVGQFSNAIMLQRMKFYDYVRSGLLYFKKEKRIFYFDIEVDHEISYEDVEDYDEDDDNILIDKIIAYKVFWISDESCKKYIDDNIKKNISIDVLFPEKIACGYIMYDDLNKKYISLEHGGYDFLLKEKLKNV